MKKVILLTLWNLALSIPMFYMISCGPSKEEIEAREKAKEDSTKAAQSLLLLENAASTGTEHAGIIPTKQYSDNADFRIGIYQVNGCEYLSFSGSVTHAGNCNNPIHSQPVHAVLPGRTGEDPVGKY